MKPRRFSDHRFTPWFWFVASICLAMGIAALIEIISHDHNQRLDLTPAQDYSISSQTRKILAGLAGDLEFITFYKGGNRGRHEEFYRLLQSARPKLIYRLIHLDGNPTQARLHGISAYGQTVVKLGNKRQLIKHLDEAQVLNALIRLSSDRIKTVYFSRGHGEQGIKGNYSGLANLLRAEGWQVSSINLALARPKADPFTVLAVAAPNKDFLEIELKRIADFLQAGGNAVFLFEPFSDAPRLESFLGGHGLALGHDIIIDQSNKIMGDDGLAPLIPLYAKGPITTGLTSAAVFPSAGSIQISQAPGKAGQAQYLAMSAKSSWATRRKTDLAKGGIGFHEEIDRKGPLPVAGMVRVGAAPEAKDSSGGRIVLFGDSDFLGNSFFDLLANKDLFLNTVNWLVKDEALISIRKPQRKYSHQHMTHGQAFWIFLICVVFAPSAALLAGALSLGFRRWRG